MFESTRIIAYKQYFKARQLFLDERNQRKLAGKVGYIHEHIDMSKQRVPLYRSLAELSRASELASGGGGAAGNKSSAAATSYSTCPASLGYSFAAGTTDGPGAFDFRQGNTASTRYWNMVRDFLRRPSEALIKCHAPKPILLATGEMDFPYMWHPRVVPTQLFRVGPLVIVGLPGEFTSMSGRRVRESVAQMLQRETAALDDDRVASSSSSDDDEHQDNELNANSTSDGGELDLAEIDLKRNVVRARLAKRQTPVGNKQQPFTVVLSGLSNIYTSYVTTLEEYVVQRYEGASTLYGPHTLQAYVNQFARLAAYLARNKPLPDGGAHKLEPPDLTRNLFTLKAGVIYDGAPSGRAFGDVLIDVDTKRAAYKCGEQVRVAFVAGNPRNDLRTEDSYLYVDKYDAHTSTWQPVATDSSWDTKFIWERTNTLFGESRALIEWNLPHDCVTGVYRIRHYGAHKSLIAQQVSQYAGTSSPFKVLASADESDEAPFARNELASLELEWQQMSSKQAAIANNKPSSDSTTTTMTGSNNNNADISRHAVGAQDAHKSRLGAIYAPFAYIGSLLAKPF